MVLYIGGSKSITAVATAFMALMATVLALSTNAAESVVGDDCGSENCGEILMLEDFAGPKHKWVEMNDPGMYLYSCATLVPLRSPV